MFSFHLSRSAVHPSAIHSCHHLTSSPDITLSLNTAVAVAEYGWTHDASKAVLLPRVVAVVSNGAGSGGVGAQVRQLVGILSHLEK